MIDLALCFWRGNPRGGGPARLSVVASLLSLLCAASFALARPQEGGSALGGTATGVRDAGGHGWALQRREIVVHPGGAGSTADKAQGASLLHLPPRVGEGGADFGTVRTVMTFPTAPVRAVGYGTNVYLIFERDAGTADAALSTADAPAGRRVLGIQAAPVGVGGEASGWRFEPPGRAESLPSLPGEGALVSVSAASVGPVALLRDGDHAAGESSWRILVLWRNDWRSFAAPWATAALQGDEPGRGEVAVPSSVEGGAGPGLKGLLAGGDRALAIAWMEGERDLMLWEGRLSKGVAEVDRGAGAEARRRGGEERLEIDWTRRQITLSTPADMAGDIEAADLAWIDGTLVLLARLAPVGADAEEGEGGGGLLVFDVTRDAGVLVAHIPGSAERGGRSRWAERLIPMHGDERFALLSAPEPTAGDDPAATAAATGAGDILEMSTTGRLWYEGEQARQGPLSLRDLRALAFMLGALAVLVVIFVFRPEATPVVTLPEGAALAALWRRSGAAGVDLLIALVLASLVMGDGAFGLVSALFAGTGAGGAVGGGHLFTGLMLAQGLGIVHCSLTECLSGRSIGKGLFGCIILTSRASPGRLEMRAALLRNIIKWGLPMLLIFAVWDPMRRHPGDLLAGTLVVEPVDEDEEVDR